MFSYDKFYGLPHLTRTRMFITVCIDLRWKQVTLENREQDGGIYMCIQRECVYCIDICRWDNLHKVHGTKHDQILQSSSRFTVFEIQRLCLAHPMFVVEFTVYRRYAWPLSGQCTHATPDNAQIRWYRMQDWRTAEAWPNITCSFWQQRSGIASLIFRHILTLNSWFTLGSRIRKSGPSRINATGVG